MIKKLGRQKKFQYIILLIVFSTVITAGCLELKWKSKQNLGFDGERALLDVQHQVSLGPRIPGTAGHDQGPQDRPIPGRTGTQEDEGNRLAPA